MNNQSSKGGSGGNSKKKKSGKHQVKKEAITPTNLHYKNLDEWLENSVKGIQLTDQDSPLSSSYNVNNSPFAFNPLSSYALRRPNNTEPWMMPPELVG